MNKALPVIQLANVRDDTAPVAQRALPKLLLVFACAASAWPVIAGEPSAPPPVIMKDSAGAATSASAKSNDRALYWYDGTKKRMLQSSPASAASLIVPQAMGEATNKAVNTVFQDQDSPGVSRALPGGVIVRFASAITASEVERRLVGHGAQVLRPIGSDRRTWLLAGGPGTASIELANAIHESGLVEAASPNWVSVRARK